MWLNNIIDPKPLQIPLFAGLTHHLKWLTRSFEYVTASDCIHILYFRCCQISYVTNGECEWHCDWCTCLQLMKTSDIKWSFEEVCQNLSSSWDQATILMSLGDSSCTYLALIVSFQQATSWVRGRTMHVSKAIKTNPSTQMRWGGGGRKKACNFANKRKMNK